MNLRNVGRNGVAGPIPNGTKLQSDQDCTDGLRRDALQRDLPDDIAIRVSLSFSFKVHFIDFFN